MFNYVDVSVILHLFPMGHKCPIHVSSQVMNRDMGTTGMTPIYLTSLI